MYCDTFVQILFEVSFLIKKWFDIFQKLNKKLDSIFIITKILHINIFNYLEISSQFK